jgi:hypothetical protein
VPDAKRRFSTIHLYMKPQHPAILTVALWAIVQCIPQAANGQLLTERLIYSRASPLNTGVWLNDANGADSLLVPGGQRAQIDDAGRYIFYMEGTPVSNPYFWGNWMRYSAFDGSNTLLFASGDYLVGSDVVPEDSSNVASYFCSILHNDFNNDPIGAVSTANCFDDAPNLRATEPRVVFHNTTLSLFTVHLDGSLRTAVPHTDYRDTWPAWSPDGNWILFGRCNYTQPGEGVFDVVNFYKVKPDGDSLTMITHNDTLGPVHYTANAIWNTDGTAVITAGFHGATYGLMIIAADGTGSEQAIATMPGDSIRFVSGTLDLDPFNTGISNVPVPERIKVWPVPARDVLNIALTDHGPWHAVLIDANGRAVKSVFGNAEQFTIPFSALSAGLYRLQVAAENGHWSVGSTVLKQ